MTGASLATLATLTLAGSLCLPACSGHTTAAEIDRIVAEARRDAARDLEVSRNGPQAVTAYLPEGDTLVTEQVQADYGRAFARCQAARGPTRSACKHAADAALAVNSANAGRAY